MSTKSSSLLKLFPFNLSPKGQFFLGYIDLFAIFFIINLHILDDPESTQSLLFQKLLMTIFLDLLIQFECLHHDTKFVLLNHMLPTATTNPNIAWSLPFLSDCNFQYFDPTDQPLANINTLPNFSLKTLDTPCK